MTIRRAPRLRIELEDNGTSMHVRGADDDQDHCFECNVTDRAAAQYRDLLKVGLAEMKERVSGEDLTIADAETALKKFSQRGVTILWEIFGSRLKDVSQLFRDCVPNWRSPSDPVNITVVAKLSQFVPLELLPIFSQTPWSPILGDQVSLIDNARRFPGFCAVIKREFPKAKVCQDLVLKNEPRLPLRCFVNQDLPAAAAAEFGFFKRNEAHIDVDGPWPPLFGLTPEQFTNALANHLQFADQNFDGGPRSPIDQIQHFICHCTIGENAYESILELSDDYKIRIFELINEFVGEDQKENPKSRPDSGPLIFLNACSGSRIDPMAVTSFPRFFLEVNGNRGFIGTETDVPNDFAAEFSQCFYRKLLSGMTLGKAMYEAKLNMLLDKNNPLGLIYTFYADPDLHVSRGVELATDVA